MFSDGRLGTLTSRFLCFFGFRWSRFRQAVIRIRSSTNELLPSDTPDFLACSVLIVSYHFDVQLRGQICTFCPTTDGPTSFNHCYSSRPTAILSDSFLWRFWTASFNIDSHRLAAFRLHQNAYALLCCAQSLEWKPQEQSFQRLLVKTANLKWLVCFKDNILSCNSASRRIKMYEWPQRIEFV